MILEVLKSFLKKMFFKIVLFLDFFFAFKYFFIQTIICETDKQPGPTA